MERPIKKAKGTLAPTKTVFVGGIPVHTTREELTQHFVAFGHLDQVFFPTSRSTQANKGYAFLLFRHVEQAVQAVGVRNGHRIRAKLVG